MKARKTSRNDPRNLRTLEDKGKTMMSLNVPNDLHEQLRTAAFETGTTMTTLLVEGAGLALARIEKTREDIEERNKRRRVKP